MLTFHSSSKDHVDSQQCSIKFKDFNKLLPIHFSLNNSSFFSYLCPRYSVLLNHICLTWWTNLWTDEKEAWLLVCLPWLRKSGNLGLLQRLSGGPTLPPRALVVPRQWKCQLEHLLRKQRDGCALSITEFVPDCDLHGWRALSLSRWEGVWWMVPVGAEVDYHPPAVWSLLGNVKGHKGPEWVWSL